MKTRLLPLLTVLIALGFHGASLADELPDYLRFREDAKSARLEIAIRTFAMPSGQSVDLIGVVHIADDAYYQELNKRFAAYDSVLFELVGDPEGLTAPAPLTDAQRMQQTDGSAVSTIQQAAGQYLGLTFQLDAIDYTGKNMVHADTTAEEFEQMQKERGETMLTLFAPCDAGPDDGPDERQGRPDRDACGLDTFGLIRILMSRDSAAEFKKALAKTFAQMESMTAAMEGPNGSAILSGRNDVVGRKIKEVLARPETATDCRVLRGRPHAWHRDIAGKGHEGEGCGRRMARGVDDAEVKNGDIPQDTARGYEPSTRNSEARFLSAASAFATCGSSAWPSMSRKNT